MCIKCLLPSCVVNKYYYIQRRGVTLKSNRSRSLKMGPINRSYSRACVTITSSGVCFVGKQLASTSFCRQVFSTLLVQRWHGSSGNVRLLNLLISSCYFWCIVFLWSGWSAFAVSPSRLSLSLSLSLNRAAHGCAEFLPVNLAIETEICGGKYELQQFHDVIYLQQSFIYPFWMALQSFPY